MLAIQHFTWIYTGLLLVVAKERCYVNTVDGDRVLAVCPDYCCGNFTFQYCCMDCAESSKGFWICNQTAVITGLVLLVIGILLVLLLVTICTQFDAMSDWSEQHIFTIQRARVGSHPDSDQTDSSQIRPHNLTVSTRPAGRIPSFLLMKLPNYDDCIHEDPPPPFEANPAAETSPTATGPLQITPTDVPSQPDQPHSAELRPDTPPPNYESVVVTT